jgi:hypothetical protein
MRDSLPRGGRAHTSCLSRGIPPQSSGSQTQKIRRRIGLKAASRKVSLTAIKKAIMSAGTQPWRFRRNGSWLGGGGFHTLTKRARYSLQPRSDVPGQRNIALLSFLGTSSAGNLRSSAGILRMNASVLKYAAARSSFREGSAVTKWISCLREGHHRHDRLAHTDPLHVCPGYTWEIWLRWRDLGRQSWMDLCGERIRG